MKNINSLILIFVALTTSGCTALMGSRTGAPSFKPIEKNIVLEQLDNGALRTPCINLPFVDKNYPELLGEIIRIYSPKVDPVGAYKISRLILREQKKKKTHLIDTKSVKLCKLNGELGFVFKAIKVQN